MTLTAASWARSTDSEFAPRTRISELYPTPPPGSTMIYGDELGPVIRGWMMRCNIPF